MKYSSGSKPASLCLPFGGIVISALLLWSFLSVSDPDQPVRVSTTTTTFTAAPRCSAVNLSEDPEDKTYFDDPHLSFLIGEHRLKKWDEKRRHWLNKHPSFAAGSSDRILMLTGSQPKACKNPIGDHLLLKLFKNKVDYCRLHGYDIFYNDAMLHPQMYSFWAKLPVVRAAMLAHPEAEWIWWVDSDAVFTDMDFKPPLDKYREHNLVVHGWPHMIHDEKSWTGLNAGVFLIRNCQWSMDFMDLWAGMGPQSPDYEKWGQIQKSIFKDKTFSDSDDQTALAYLIYKYKDTWATKINLEGDYDFESYWLGIVDILGNLTEKYGSLERRVRTLRRRHAEKVSESYGARREEYLAKEAGSGGIGRGSWRRPPLTHFTGCQPCNGKHNPNYRADACWNGIVKALNYADNQVLRKYGFVHPDLQDTGSVVPVPFDYSDGSPLMAAE